MSLLTIFSDCLHFKFNKCKIKKYFLACDLETLCNMALAQCTNGKFIHAASKWNSLQTCSLYMQSFSLWSLQYDVSDFLKETNGENKFKLPLHYKSNEFCTCFIYIKLLILNHIKL